MKAIAITAARSAAFVLTACGQADGPSANVDPAPIPASVSDVYKSADGKVTLNFDGENVKITFKVGKDYRYSNEGNSVKWIYEATGVAEACEIKRSPELYCAVSRQAYTKIG